MQTTTKRAEVEIVKQQHANWCKNSFGNIVLCFPFSCPEGALLQTKLVRDLWVLSKNLPNKLLISLTFLSQPSPYPHTHTARLEFPVDGPAQTPTLVRKTYFEDEHERQKKEEKLQNRNACHDGAFWLNLGSLHCWHTFLFTRARETDYY